ncbi:hypothetical protein VP01_1300g3, partial [Puccinia sorghi]
KFSAVKPKGTRHTSEKDSQLPSELVFLSTLQRLLWYFYTIDRPTSNCAIAQSSQHFFSDGQYLLADSAFSTTIYMVPAFKKNRNSTLTNKQQAFNRHLSGIQVVIENCIGLFKNIFQSLKGLRLRVSDQRDLNRITAWINLFDFYTYLIGISLTSPVIRCLLIGTGVVLHMFLLEGSDVEVDDLDVVHVSGGQNNEFELLNPGTVAGNQKRNEMASSLIFRNNQN